MTEIQEYGSRKGKSGRSMSEKTEKVAKINRALDLYIRLSKGRTIYKAEEALRARVDERSIQRDIDAIRQFLEERRSSDGNECRSIVYDHSRKGFVMVGEEASEMWLLSQGDRIEVLRPEKLRQEMKSRLLSMLQRYEEPES